MEELVVNEDTTSFVVDPKIWSAETDGRIYLGMPERFHDILSPALRGGVPGGESSSC